MKKFKIYSMKKYFTLLLFQLLFSSNYIFAQNVDMAQGLRSSGKIYVVVGVLCIIFIGLVAYLINLDIKLNKLKKEFDTKSH